MRSIPREQVQKRVAAENPWWNAPHTIGDLYGSWLPRPYLRLFQPLLQTVAVNRAVLLMGPRRVGKTVLIHHAIAALIEGNIDPRQLCYVSVDNPIYNSCGLEDLLNDYLAASGSAENGSQRYVFFDEIQYLRNWEIELKTLVDTYP